MREAWIDNAKGIAILLIIIGHAGLGLTGPVNVLWVFGVHLVMFFLVSGYTLKKKEFTVEFLNNRFRRLMIPYFCTCFAVLMMDVWNLYYWVHDLSIRTVTFWIRQDLVRSFFASGTFTRFVDIEIGIRIGALWFLPAMFFATVLCQGLLNITHNTWQFGMASVGLAVIAMVTRNFIWLPFSIQSAMLASVFLWAGYSIHQKRLLDKLRWYHYAAAQVIFLWGLYNGYCGTDFVTAYLNDVLISPIVGISGCLLIYGVARVMPGGILAYLGRMSLTIMCVHLFSLETLRGYINRTLDTMQLSGNPREWMRILIEIIIAVLGAALIERVKVYFSSVRAGRAKNAEQMRDVHEWSTEMLFGGLFLVLYLSGTGNEDNQLLPIIRICLPAVFVFLAGYQRTETIGIASYIENLIRRYILPCAAFEVYSVVHPEFSALAIGRLLWYLLLTELLYTAAEAGIKKETVRGAILVLISVVGMTIGKKGYMLPYGSDIALYLIVYYLAGGLFRKYRLMEKASSNPWTYFIISPVFVYMVYSGNANIMMQSYGRYGSIIVGALAGCILVYMMSSWMAEIGGLPVKMVGVFGRIPFSYVVLISGLMCRLISKWLAEWFVPDGIIHLTALCSLELLIAGVVYGIIWLISEKGIKASWERSGIKTS